MPQPGAKGWEAGLSNRASRQGVLTAVVLCQHLFQISNQSAKATAHQLTLGGFLPAAAGTSGPQ